MFRSIKNSTRLVQRSLFKISRAQKPILAQRQQFFRTVGVVGGGPAGISAARKALSLGIMPTVFERNGRLGGLCRDVRHPHDSSVFTPVGATLLGHSQNYRFIRQFMREQNIKELHPFPTYKEGIPINDMLSQLSFLEKAKFAWHFAKQLERFTYKVVTPYLYARDQHHEQLPNPDFDLPFAQYAQKHDLGLINTFLIPFVTGFGYGSMDQIATYSVAEYMEKTIIPEVAATGIICHKSPLRLVEGGFQNLVEKMAEDKGIEKLTSVNITQINRSNVGPTIRFTQNNIPYERHFDMLVLALSPYHWRDLGMKLSAAEESHIDQGFCNAYSVASVSMKNSNKTAYPKQNRFFPAGLDQNLTGKMALFVTLDNRENPNGRFGTLYRTPKQHQMKEGKINIQREQEEFKQELDEFAKQQKLDIQLHQVFTWPYGFSTSSYAQRVAMDKVQLCEDLQTLRVGSSFKGGFESVAAVTAQVDRIFEEKVRPRMR